MIDVKKLDIVKARKGLLKKEFSAKELTTAYLNRIEKFKDLNAFITVTADIALAQAEKADAEISKGEGARPLLGIPLGIKDLYCTKGIRTTAGSKMLEDFVPPYESTVSQNLLDDGAIFLGKTNMDEFAMGSANITSYFGHVKLCYRKKSDSEIDLVPGGSSGGSASAVAAGLALSSTGSDTGGSIRQPAAFSGLVGMKPTYGLCSRWGIVAFASSLDQAGPISKNVSDAAIMLSSMTGYDPKDSTSINTPKVDYTTFLGKSIKGMKIGLAKQYLDGINEEGVRTIEKAKKWLEDAGCELIEIDLPMTKYALPAYHIIAPAEASSNLARYDGVRFGYREDADNIEDLYIKTRSNGFGEEVKRRIMTGTYVLSAGYYDAYYSKALKVQKLIKEDFRDHAFSKVDFILTLTTMRTAFGVTESQTLDPIEMYLNDIFTVTANIAELPGVSVPAGLSEDGLPLGVQLIGNRLSEGNMFSVAHVIEQSADFESLKEQMIDITREAA